jgi:hypothetical protein
MCSHSPFLLTRDYHEAPVLDDGELEFPDLPVEDPVLAVTGSFPESNPFGRKFSALHYFLSLCYLRDGIPTDVVNGESNKLLLDVENRTGKNVTLLTVAGEFLDSTTDKLIRAVRMSIQ